MWYEVDPRLPRATYCCVWKLGDSLPKINDETRNATRLCCPTSYKKMFVTLSLYGSHSRGPRANSWLDYRRWFESGLSYSPLDVWTREPLQIPQAFNAEDSQQDDRHLCRIFHSTHTERRLKFPSQRLGNRALQRRCGHENIIKIQVAGAVKLH